MDQITTYLAMDGKAAFVWPAYGVALLVLGGLAVASLRRLARAAAGLAALERARPHRARRR
jgi:heme exporter protein D